MSAFTFSKFAETQFKEITEAEDEEQNLRPDSQQASDSDRLYIAMTLRKQQEVKLTDFKMMRQIESTGFSQIWRVETLRKSKEFKFFAMKFIAKAKNFKQVQVDKAMNELKFMKIIKSSKFVVQAYYAF